MSSIIHKYNAEYEDDGSRHLLPVYQSLPEGSAWDDFNRPDGAAGSTPLGGYPWSALSSDGTAAPIIASHQLAVDSLGGGSFVMTTVDVGEPDYEVTFTMAAAGLVHLFRGVDMANHLVLAASGGNLIIRKRVANSLQTAVTGPAFTSFLNKVMKVRCEGTAISVWADGALLIDAATVTDFAATGTKVGVYFTSTAGRLAAPFSAIPV